MDTTETTTAPTTTASAPSTAPAPETPGVFTQEQVNRIAAAARAEGKQSAERQVAPVPPAPAGKITLESLQAELETTRLRASYEKRAGKAGIPDDVSDDAFDLYRGKPADQRDAWLDGFAKRFMPPTTTPPASTTPAPGPEPKQVAAPNTPGRVDPITSGGLLDIFNLTHQQLSDLGPAGLRVEFEKITSAGNRMSGAPARPTVPKR